MASRALEIVLSPTEAAYIADITPRAVNRAIDRREVKPVRLRGKDKPVRGLGFEELVYLILRRDLGGVLTPGGKRAVYNELRRRGPTAATAPDIQLGPLMIEVKTAASRVRQQLDHLRRAEQQVLIDPEIRGGEPVVRGTRIPVHMLADLAAAGAKAEELLDDYPGLNAEALEAALLYARIHPRRGRPRRPPWHKDRRKSSRSTPARARRKPIRPTAARAGR